MTVSIQVLRDSYVKPKPPAPPVEEVELAGVDVLFKRMNLRFAYFFPETLSAAALKASLAEVLSRIPILAGRQRSKGRRHWIEVNGAGVQVREQLARVRGGEGAIDDRFLRTHIHNFIHGKEAAAVNDAGASNLIVTLTEIEYETESPGLFSCMAGGVFAGCYPEGSNPESQDVAFEGGPGGSHVAKPVKYAVGVCISHDIADGGSIAGFLLAWALASTGQPFPPAAHDRAILRQIPPKTRAQIEALPIPAGLLRMNLWKNAYFLTKMASMALLGQYDFVKLRFSGKELEALKAATMAPLTKLGPDVWVSTSNALAAHLWPLLSELMGEETGWAGDCKEEGKDRLVPFSVIVNYRKPFGLPASYFGNAVGMRTVPVDEPLTLPGMPETPEALAKAKAMAQALPDTTRRALMIRRACAVTPQVKEAFLQEAHYLQLAAEKGEHDKMMFRGMFNVASGMPLLLWDDVSGFQPGGMGFGLCGVTACRADFFLQPFFGIALVMPTAPGADGLAGKEISVCLHKRSIRKLATPAYQARLHCYAPSSSASATTTPAATTAAAAAVNGVGRKQQQQGGKPPRAPAKAGAAVGEESKQAEPMTEAQP